MAPKQLRAMIGGRERIIGFWSKREDGPFRDLYAIARDTRNHVEGLTIASENIRNDKRLSDEAKKQDIAATAKDRLYFLGQLQRNFETFKSHVDERAAKLTAVKPYRDIDPAAVHIDIALAAQLRAMTPSERNSRVLMGTDKAYVDATLRLPRELTGISAEWYARVVKEAAVRANPHEAQEIEDLYVAVGEAQDTLQHAFSIVGKEAGATLTERIEAAGDGAKDLVKGVSESTIEGIQERLARAQAELDAEADKEKKDVLGSLANDDPGQSAA
jgi:hypothetical protein